MILHFTGVPLSQNKANICIGVKRVKSPAYTQYETNIVARLWLQAEKVKPFPHKTPLEVICNWYLTNDINTDWDNPIKPLMDVLVKYGVIDDDRYIRKGIVMKHKSKTNHFDVEIKEI